MGDRWGVGGGSGGVVFMFHVLLSSSIHFIPFTLLLFTATTLVPSWTPLILLPSPHHHLLSSPTISFLSIPPFLPSLSLLPPALSVGHRDPFPYQSIDSHSVHYEQQSEVRRGKRGGETDIYMERERANEIRRQR